MTEIGDSEQERITSVIQITKEDPILSRMFKYSTLEADAENLTDRNTREETLQDLKAFVQRGWGQNKQAK